MSLQIDYRPTALDEIVGNQTTVASLASYIKGVKKGTKQGRSFLITGASGLGKTTIARIIASEFGCYNPEGDSSKLDLDFVEINASDFKGIEMIRSIRKQIKYAPMNGAYKVFFLDEAAKLSADAQEAFLKPLEEPPQHIIFILATTNPEKLKVTLKRRCAHFAMNPLTEEDVIGLMKDILAEEEKEISDEVLEIIAETSMCSPGIALGALDVIIDLPPKQQKKKALEAVTSQNQAIELVQAIVRGQSWNKVSKILQNLKKEEPEGIRRLVLAYCSSILLKKDDAVVYLIMDSFRDPLYDLGFPGLVMYCYEACKGEN